MRCLVFANAAQVFGELGTSSRHPNKFAQWLLERLGRSLPAGICTTEAAEWGPHPSLS